MENIKTIADKYSQKAHLVNFINFSFLSASIGNVIYMFSKGSVGGGIMAIFFWVMLLIFLMQYLKNVKRGAQIVHGKVINKEAISYPGRASTIFHTYYKVAIKSGDLTKDMEIFEDLYEKVEVNNDYEFVANAEGVIMATTSDISKPGNIIEKNLKSALVATTIFGMIFLTTSILLIIKLTI